MTWTEKDAKGKWCPEARKWGSFSEGTGMGPFSGAAGFNRGSKEGCSCVGSNCMAWRWAQPEFIEAGIPRLDRMGYCGKAGRPYGIIE